MALYRKIERQGKVSGATKDDGRNYKKTKSELRINQYSKEESYQIGDRVKTFLGQGVIVKIKGNEYLVDMDNQPAKIWQKQSELSLI